MRIKDIAKLSTRMFKTNPSRTWLTILGMGVGSAAVVALVGLGFGLQGVLLERIVFGETLLSLNVANPSSELIQLTQKSVDAFARLDAVKDVAPLASVPALMTLEGLTGNILLHGLEPAYFRYTGQTAVAGSLFTDKSAPQNTSDVILSAAALKLFGIEEPESALGKSVSFRIFVEAQAGEDEQEVEIAKHYRISGISNDEAAITATILLGQLRQHMSVPHFERVQVRVTDQEALSPTEVSIVEMGFVVTTLSKTVEQANKIFKGVQAVLAVFGGIALVVSAIGMFNTMTVTLLERTGEIGIMRTIGASSADIKVLFVAEAMIVGFLGGIVGIVIGVSIGLGLNGLLNFAAARFGGVAVSIFRYPPLFLIFIELFSGIVGFLTGVFPARRAAALNPLDAIRYK